MFDAEFNVFNVVNPVTDIESDAATPMEIGPAVFTIKLPETLVPLAIFVVVDVFVTTNAPFTPFTI